MALPKCRQECVRAPLSGEYLSNDSCYCVQGCFQWESLKDLWQTKASQRILDRLEALSSTTRALEAFRGKLCISVMAGPLEAVCVLWLLLSGMLLWQCTDTAVVDVMYRACEVYRPSHALSSQHLCRLSCKAFPAQQRGKYSSEWRTPFDG